MTSWPKLVRFSITLSLLGVLVVSGLDQVATAAAHPGESQDDIPEGWSWNPPGMVVAPILLYHHVADGASRSRYIVPVREFEKQMHSLHKWGYTSIPFSLLSAALREGAYLPSKPVVITFDDGYADNYQQAFPVMLRYGYVGNLFLIVDQLDYKGYLTTAQVKDLVAAGWEIGSHTFSHTSLRSPRVRMEHEIDQSRLALEQLFGTPVTSFSYPYAITSPYTTRWVQKAGYTSAVGVGTIYRHSGKSQYYLSRIEVRRDYSLADFAGLLPWKGDLPADDLSARYAKIEHIYLPER